MSRAQASQSAAALHPLRRRDLAGLADLYLALGEAVPPRWHPSHPEHPGNPQPVPMVGGKLAALRR